MGPGEKVSQHPSRAEAGEVPKRVPLHPTLSSHLPPVLVRVIHQHDAISRPGRRKLASIWSRRDLPSRILTVPAPRCSACPTSARGGFLMPLEGGHRVSTAPADTLQDRARAVGRSHAINTHPSWILGSSSPLWAQQPQPRQGKVSEGPPHVPRSGNTQP